MPLQPTISAIVLNYRHPQQTVACVQALQKQTIADQVKMIVVDNHSKDDSIGVLRNRLGCMENVRIIEVPKNIPIFFGTNNFLL